MAGLRRGTVAPRVLSPAAVPTVFSSAASDTDRMSIARSPWVRRSLVLGCAAAGLWCVAGMGHGSSAEAATVAPPAPAHAAAAAPAGPVGTLLAQTSKSVTTAVAPVAEAVHTVLAPVVAAQPAKHPVAHPTPVADALKPLVTQVKSTLVVVQKAVPAVVEQVTTTVDRTISTVLPGTPPVLTPIVTPILAPIAAPVALPDPVAIVTPVIHKATAPVRHAAANVVVAHQTLNTSAKTVAVTTHSAPTASLAVTHASVVTPAAKTFVVRSDRTADAPQAPAMSTIASPKTRPALASSAPQGEHRPRRPMPTAPTGTDPAPGVGGSTSLSSHAELALVAAEETARSAHLPTAAILARHLVPPRERATAPAASPD